MVLLGLVMGSCAWGAGVPSSSDTMAALRVRMEVERGKEEELQLLQLDVDRLKLEVEKKKAMVELGRIPADGRDPAATDVSELRSSPVLRALFITTGHKEAVFDVNGRELCAGEGGDVDGRIVKDISANGVTLKDKDGTESFLRPGA
jgi:hypothetical protein